MVDAPPRPVSAPPAEEPEGATIAQEKPPVSLEADAVVAVPEAATTPPPKMPTPPAAFPAPAAKAAVAAPPAPARAPTPPAPIAPKPAPPKPVAAPPKVTAPATPQAIVEAPKRMPSKPEVPQDAELDFSGMKDKAKSDRKVPAAEAAAPAPAPAPAPEEAKPTGPAAKYLAPSNPETAELEKSDPRHAAARRLARLSVSEIKLYHEADVTEGRTKKDLWSRLQADISLATQTYDKRVDQEVRDRFDYLYDEILRQLAQGDAELLGAGAPKPKKAAAGAAPDSESSKSTAPAVTKRASEPIPAEAKPEPEPEPKIEPKIEAKAEPAPAPVVAPPAEAKPTMPGARFAPPSNPETAELEKSDPRHAAARRLARLSVSEIKLYHEEEVKAGREKKDLYTRLGADISLAKQTFEKRVDQEVRDRFDYLYDEIVRQLAEGKEELLGPDAPPKKKPTDSQKVAPAPAPPEAKPEPKPEPAKIEPPKSEPKAAAAAPAPVAPAPAPAPAAAAPAASATTQPSVVSKYLAPSNPATAELEKGDPRHAAARRLARLSVSEIKLYHEDEVKAGREKKDLWSRLQGDISLAKQTYEKRVDQEVRDRFDYLYDEILRQLAEGDSDKLGPDAPKPKQN